MTDHPKHDPDDEALHGPDARLSAEDAELVAAAAQLPVLRPSRDLWDGIAARISTPELALPPRTAASRPTMWSVAQLATAAAVLVAVTAGVTWQVAQQRVAPTPDVAVLIQATDDDSGTALPTVRVAAAYDQEIAELRAILALRDLGLDDATVRVLDDNLKVIDDAIAGARAALEADPASALLAQRLAGAYDMKLDLLRRLAALTEIS
jgi:hypothetical protein